MICSDDVRGNAWHVVQNAEQTRLGQSRNKFHGHIISKWCIQAQIIPENINDNYTINVHHIKECMRSNSTPAHKNSEHIGAYTGF